MDSILLLSMFIFVEHVIVEIFYLSGGLISVYIPATVESGCTPGCTPWVFNDGNIMDGTAKRGG